MSTINRIDKVSHLVTAALSTFRQEPGSPNLSYRVSKYCNGVSVVYDVGSNNVERAVAVECQGSGPKFSFEVRIPYYNQHVVLARLIQKHLGKEGFESYPLTHPLA